MRPPRLGPGARVALVSPAGPLGEGALERAVERVRGWGWEPIVGPHANGRHGFLAAPDAERLADLNAALRDPRVDAVWALRGGYGTLRIIEEVDREALRRRPRLFLGFSDNTALHQAIHQVGLISIHGPHPAVEELPPFTERALLRVVTSAEAVGEMPLPEGEPAPIALAPGVAEGPLVGGNLSMLCSLLGTPFAARTEGAILFLEEIAEPVYRVDRMLTQLGLAGALDGVRGVAIGGFSECPDDGVAGLPSTLEVLRERLASRGIPVLAGLPFGHEPVTWTLPHGVAARLDASAGTLTILEPAVR